MFYKERIVWLRFITIKKLFNLLLLYFDFYLSKVFKKAYTRAYPLSVSIEPTTACNLECPACPSGLKSFTRPIGNMKDEVFEKILNELHSYLFQINFYFQGEPFINTKIFNWIKSAAAKKIYTVTSTNAHFLTTDICDKIVQSNLHKIIISLDGMTQEVYEQYRKSGEIKKVFQGIDNLLQSKKKHHSQYPFIVLQWVVFKHNVHQINDFIAYCKKTEIDYHQIKTAQVYSDEQYQTLIPSNQKLSRYFVNQKSFKINAPLNNECWRMVASCVFTQNGDVVPCCFDKDAKYQFGNIINDSFKNIWYHSSYMQFRNQILKNRKAIDICNNCSEGSKVWV